MSDKHIIHLENGKLANDTPHSEVKDILAAAVNSSLTNGIVIHFHGGLVGEARARELAQRLEPIYEDGGAYPIFYVWESGLLETLRNNLNELADERLFRILLRKILNIVTRKFSQSADSRGSGTLPGVDTYDMEQAVEEALDAKNESLWPDEPAVPDDLNEISDAEEKVLVAELELDSPLRNELQAITNGLREKSDIAMDAASRSATVRASSETLMDPESIEKLLDRPDAGSRGIISILKAAKAIVGVSASVIRRFLNDRDHGLHATIVEEILREFYLANVGQTIWSTMKKDTEDSFQPGHEIFGGTALLHELKSLAKRGASIPRVTLIGHSTGAVYICHFLKAADDMELPDSIKFDVIYLAPASTFDLTSEAFSQHRSRIRNFRMFTMTDDNEKKDGLVPVLYPYSLLYFVSGVVEKDADTPVVGMQRYFTLPQYDTDQFSGVKAIREFVVADEDRAVWSVSDEGPGKKTRALKHGDFDNDHDTLSSVKHILGAGF